MDRCAEFLGQVGLGRRSRACAAGGVDESTDNDGESEHGPIIWSSVREKAKSKSVRFFSGSVLTMVKPVNMSLWFESRALFPSRVPAGSCSMPRG